MSELLNGNLTPQYIILTHEHFDHIWGCNELIKNFNPTIICSAACAERIIDPKKNLSLFYDQQGFSVSGNILLIENLNYSLEWEKNKIDFFISEGHTDAGICFYFDKNIFTGDTLIEGEKTVTKLFCGSKKNLLKTIDKIKEFQNNGYEVFPGHGNTFFLDGYDLNKML
jgi:glyoxylase-like metal-dependent hydrolase (beta-lactamase superfamily II)